MDTIYALASAPGRSGVAVIRISGPGAFVAAEALAGPLPCPGRSLRKLRAEDDLLDEALVLTFAAGASFTGEPVVELHCHGSPAVVSGVLATLGQLPDLRAAQAGEFTQRAFENGRLDLAQVEGLADLIDAETQAQRQQAMRSLGGALGRRAEVWREKLVRAAALIEVTVDFADEEVPEDVGPEVGELLGQVVAELRQEIDKSAGAERLRDGFEVAILGAPNVGKSTLLNALAGRDAAITSEIAGTTRDVIEVRMDLAGLPVTVLDTAGLREASDRIEQIGIERALSRAEGADLRVHLIEPGEQPISAVREGDIVVASKADIDARGEVSAVSGYGVDRLVEKIIDRLRAKVPGSAIATRERHRQGMRRAVDALELAADRLDLLGTEPEILAADVRTAVHAVDELVGKVDVEDLLDEIFSSFCIGK